MLFNSYVFAAFFAVVYTTYLACHRWTRAQNLMLLAASYLFYGWWDWRFLGLIALSTAVDYVAGLKIACAPTEVARRCWLWLSVATNLGILGAFKYLGFFLDSLQPLLGAIGIEGALPSLRLVLPVGISFYTFQSMSYTIDVYRRRGEACRDPFDFALYVAFFPQLVAGPIERSTRLLGQITRPRTLNTPAIEAGVWLVVWGLFKKIVVADNAALLANPVFAAPEAHAGSALLLGALAFTVQIYCDFSGYSNIARGLAKLLGFDLMVNFKLPYFALSPSDFWRRWHVSLSSWLRDYLYISLGGDRHGSWRTYRNLMVTMLLGGLWHGAAWNFVLWGLFHGLLLIAYRPLEERPRLLPDGVAADLARASVMFGLTVVGWVIFRVESFADLGHFAAVFLPAASVPWHGFALLAALWLPVLSIEISQLACDDLLTPLRMPPIGRGVLFGALIAACVGFHTGASTEFIYFQF